MLVKTKSREILDSLLHNSTLQNFKTFLLTGQTIRKSDFGKKDFFVLLGLDFVLALFIVPILLILGAGDLEHALGFSDNKGLYFILGMTLIPVLEELMYRYPLNLKTKAIIIAAFLSIPLLIITPGWIGAGHLVFLAGLVICKVAPKQLPMKYVIYISAGAFALIHLDNFTDLDYLSYFYLLPFLVLSQFLGGLIICFVRLSHGLMTAIYFHALFNGILGLTMFLE